MILFVHVALSLVGIFSGLVVVIGLLTARRLDGWTATFLATTVATSVTGYALPADRILPSHIVGAISLVILTVAIIARYARHLAGAWRWIYVLTAVIALYFNVFIGLVQAFLRVPALKELAPTQTEPAFLVAQIATLALFAGLAVAGAIKFRTMPSMT
jgi:hypothetical protein